MIDQNTYNLLLSEYSVSIQTLETLSLDKNSTLQSPGFSILDCVAKQIPYNDILGLIQYVYGTNLYNANEMYQVVVDKRKPIEIVFENEVKKKSIA
ncbi:hypothetical protein VF04_03875 [Nostoc linckia z7]|uniref:Uncharacterized protein n=2 Tax=Nostoc linckia TaxID=92942 RepID=A0A9Q6EN14_NOSLI|nr:hypothetical protein [Nostoc linckia]PHK42995.1 hypothetical protein VF12_01340 [Nostoc linckia z15]PHK48152.1 hypothetical protein VF13_02315 [Nostoc linckia z16]PHJ64936.1 hypothetical protein VF02_11365 [Nostoc linckia z1]PHJ70113.1 hypothetical protein VF05_11520 [Nostoc linckia z3]PHJ75014.1 hypothetical protein VF03_11680 [Nostoc linckia z2]